MLDKAVVDLSHWDEVDSFEDAKDDGVVGIIHKATELNNYFDPCLLTLLWTEMRRGRACNCFIVAFFTKCRGHQGSDVPVFNSMIV